MKALFYTLVFLLFVPQTAFAAICYVQPTQKKEKCEIIICVTKGFPSSAGCRPAFREMIKRIIRRKSPIPFPTNCMCTWFPQLVTPTHDYYPPQLTKTTLLDDQSAKLISNVSSKTDTLYSQQLDGADSNAIAPEYQTRVQEFVQSNPAAYSSNCSNSNFYPSNYSKSCNMRTKEASMTYQILPLGPADDDGDYYRHEYRLTTNPHDPSIQNSETRIVLRHGYYVESCRLYEGSRLVSNNNCEYLQSEIEPYYYPGNGGGDIIVTPGDPTDETNQEFRDSDSLLVFE